MTRQTRSLLAMLASLLLSVTASAQSQPSEAYPIRLTRPSRVGQAFRLQASAAVLNDITITLAPDRKDANQRVAGLQVDGRGEVLEVDGRGDVRKLKITVGQCVGTEDDRQRELVRKGAVIVVTAGEKDPSFSIDGKPADKDTADLLELIFPLREDKGPDDDAIFGTREKKRVGESWPINPAAAAEDLKAIGGQAKPENIRGSFKLAAVERHDGRAVLKLEGRMEVTDFLPPRPDDLPGDVTLEPSSATFQITTLMPVDPALPSPSESSTMVFTTPMTRTADGQPVKLQVVTRRAVEIRATYDPPPTEVTSRPATQPTTR